MIYIVQPGNTLYSIALAYGVTQEQLAYDNQIADGQPLVVGQALYILTEEERTGNAAPAKRFFGYAYPFIQDAVLRECLLYMQALYIFSYGFTTSGELLPIDDERLIRTAQEYGVEPVLVLTPFSESGSFNNQLVNALLNDAAVRQNLIGNLLVVM